MTLKKPNYLKTTYLKMWKDINLVIILKSFFFQRQQLWQVSAKQIQVSYFHKWFCSDSPAFSGYSLVTRFTLLAFCNMPCDSKLLHLTTEGTLSKQIKAVVILNHMQQYLLSLLRLYFLNCQVIHTRRSLTWCEHTNCFICCHCFTAYWVRGEWGPSG